MTILAISGNQGVKTSKLQFLTKTTFYISVGQNSRTMFSKKKQQIILSLDFSVSILKIHKGDVRFAAFPSHFFVYEV